MATGITETLDNDLQTSKSENNLNKLLNVNAKWEETEFEPSNVEGVDSQNEFILYSINKDAGETEGKYSGTFLENVEEKEHEDLEAEIENETEHCNELESTLNEEDSFSALAEASSKADSDVFGYQYWKEDYQEAEEKKEDEISYQEKKDFEEESIRAITPSEETVLEEKISIDDTSALIKQIKNLKKEQIILQMRNNYLHYKYCEFLLAHSRIDAVEKGLDQVMVHNDVRYQLALEEYSEIKFKVDSQLENLKNDIQKLEEALDALETNFNNVYSELVSLELMNAFDLKFSGKTGKRLSKQEIYALLEKEERRSQDLTEVRIKYIQCGNILKNLKKNLRKLKGSKADRADKLYLNLMAHKQVLIDRKEEQRENMRKLQKKYYVYPTILNYLKENSYHVENCIVHEKNKWEEIKWIQDNLQKKVVQLGKKRTSLRSKNNKLQESLGCFNSPTLIKN